MADSGGAGKKSRFEIDDGVDRSREFEDFEAERKKEQERKAKEAKEKEQQKEDERHKASEKQFQNRDTVFLWGPTLITAPLVPAFLAMLTAAIGTAVVEWHFIDFSSACLQVQAYVVGEVVMCYIFLGTYMAMLIGPRICARACGTTTLLFVYYGLFFLIFFGLNVWGVYVVYTLDFCINPLALTVRTDDTAAIWYCATVFTGVYWLGFLVLCAYGCYFAKWQADQKKKAHNVLRGLRVANKTIDYSGYTSVAEEANIQSSDEEEAHPLQYSKKKLDKKRVSQFEDWEKKQAAEAQTTGNDSGGGGGGAGGADTEEAGTADSAEAEGGAEAAGEEGEREWTAEEIAAYEAQHAHAQ